MLLKEIKQIFHRELANNYPEEEINSFFYMLVEHYLELERFVLALEPELQLSKEEETPFFNGLSQLKLHKPIQYITGTAQFCELQFKVNQAVLIPRPETEELVQWVIESVTASTATDIRILDIGTGSGCIAISLAKKLPKAKVYALDISEAALKVATENAAINNVAVTFIHADILQLKTLDMNFNFIVSNPPYVREKERVDMHKNVTEYEPPLALYVPNEDALRFYEKIGSFGVENLNSEGKLFLEINQYLVTETISLLEKQKYSAIALKKDIFGNERMLMGSNS